MMSVKAVVQTRWILEVYGSKSELAVVEMEDARC